MWEYTDKVKEHFFNPKNIGKIEDADMEAEIGNMTCGDALKLYIKLDNEKKKIVDAKFQTFGCGSAIASSSALTELLKGKTIEEAEKITNKEIAEYLGGLPEEKMHCSVMGHEALEKALAIYKGEDVEEYSELDDSPIVCKCFGVTENKIRKAIDENNLKTVDEVTHYTKAGGACGQCKPKIQDILNEMNPDRFVKKEMSEYQRVKAIEKIINEEVKPALVKDGGDIEIIDIKDKTVKVRLLGQCSHCIASMGTIKGLVENKLKEFVDQDIAVEEVEK